MSCAAIHISSVVQIASAGETQEPLRLASCMAAESPIYVYVSNDETSIYYSKSLNVLLAKIQEKEPLKIDASSLSFLLQDGVIPSPKSIYKSLYILSIGNIFTAINRNKRWQCHFDYHFPFEANTEHKVALPRKQRDNQLLALLASSIERRAPEGKPLTLFHSAGKDSNTIALALAEAGRSKHVTSFTYRAVGANDESELVAGICKKLGFKHHIADVDALSASVVKARLSAYFKQANMPCMDNASLLYPLFSNALSAGSNIIDGMGNDVYIGHVPGKAEYKRQKFQMSTALLSKCMKPALGTFHYQSLSKTKAHISGLSGISSLELEKIFPAHKDTYAFWQNLSQAYAHTDYFEFRAKVRGGLIDTEKFVRKLRVASDRYAWNLFLPWMDEDVAQFVHAIPEAQRFDRQRLKNKLFLRDLLKEKLTLDSDQLGKMGFAFDHYSLLQSVENYVRENILSCSAWHHQEIESYLAIVQKGAASANKYQAHWQLRLYRLFVISAWLNHRQLKVG